jgi:hypothetical protein
MAEGKKFGRKPKAREAPKRMAEGEPLSECDHSNISRLTAHGMYACMIDPSLHFSQQGVEAHFADHVAAIEALAPVNLSTIFSRKRPEPFQRKTPICVIAGDVRDD